MVFGQLVTPVQCCAEAAARKFEMVNFVVEQKVHFATDKIGPASAAKTSVHVCSEQNRPSTRMVA